MSLVPFPAEVIKRRCGACHLKANVEPYSGMSKGDQYQFGKRGPPQALVTNFSDFNLVIRLAYLKFGEAGPHQSLCNLSRREKSLFIQAPLARGSGGLGLCAGEVFAETTDADYVQILSAIRDAAERLDQQKRFDVPGFRPSPYYVRQMQHFGILPQELSADAPIDPLRRRSGVLGVVLAPPHRMKARRAGRRLPIACCGPLDARALVR